MLYRLDTTRFNTSKSQKKILNKFNRYVKGTHHSTTTTTTTTKQANFVQVKTLRDIIHESEDPLQNERKLEVRQATTICLNIPLTNYFGFRLCWNLLL